MTKSWLALIAGLGLAGASGLAHAQQGDTGGSNDQPMAKPDKMDKADTKDKSDKMMQGKSLDEPKKHLGQVDIYLHDAINNTKVLYGDTQLQPGHSDATIDKEGINNIDRALSGALMHLSHIKALPEAKGAEMTKVDTLQRDLMQARSMVGQLRSSLKDRAEFASMTAQLFAKLHDADDQFGAIADAQNLTRVDKINVPERQPVKGTGEPEKSEKPMNVPSPTTKDLPAPSGNY